ncbi:type ISP restriction/modification enzyme [Sphingomonas sp. 28-62-11]|uniref:type ISP restriction/modification enzyme n=1 Tax=Sphingomonas sp. 28-62-11 TaxID=1970432 RepID=UPI0035A8370C
MLREAFKDLLKRWGRSQDLQFVPEHTITTAQKNRIYLDGALLHALRVPFGYWEAKDADDDLDAEIAAKSRKGYPRDNIIYSDDHTAILIQDGHEMLRVAMDDTDALYPLLIRFFAHERQEIADFNKAVKQFGQDLPQVLTALRDLIAEKRAASRDFAAAEAAFLKHAQDAINPAVSEEDVQEMLIQHILTEDIFAKVFDNPDFHRQNNVASELYKLEEKLFGYGEKQKLLRALQPYYAGISQAAAVIQSHSEKQGFLKGLYENFYKVYNAKAADRLGVVYTPGEIVRFMIRSADWLCEKHFGKNLVDRGVEILDPATGTGTFIVELLEHFRGDHAKLRHKYKEELHANEVAILPYYVANLNIEATYQAITGQFAEFENLCFVDTLDNVDALGIHSGHQFDLLGGMADENMERVKRQNRRKISVIIGNPPYNANQQNENDNNKNRAYAHIDKRIKNTYIKASTAQKTKLYDMYARFYRWASDRLGDEGVLAFVTNRSFIDSRTFDGFRKLVARDFQEIWLVDLGGDIRANPRLSGTTHNVFGIQTGVSIAILVRTKDTSDCKIRYVRRPEDEKAESKLAWLSSIRLAELTTTLIKPDEKGRWLDQTEDGVWTAFMPLADKQTKASVTKREERAIIRTFANGVKTNRDDWLYDFSEKTLIEKIKYFSTVFNKSINPNGKGFINFPNDIKWSRDLKNKPTSFDLNSKLIRNSLWRPFTRKKYYSFRQLSDVQTNLHNGIYGDDLFSLNKLIAVSGGSASKPFQCLATDNLVDYEAIEKSNLLARYRYLKSGERIDNITDWALNKFVAHYGKKGVTKDAIFHYVYAVLHDPIYRETYALNLKREFPRIPFYPDFARWAAWGEALMAMHIGYEDVAPWPVERIDTPSKRAEGTHPKPILKSQPETGVVIIDADTQITGIPPEAWSYRLGNRSAIDWVLDQHKEKKPRDPTIAAKFNTYRFADYKESMIALLAKVVRVSVDTVAITEAMKAVERDG